MFIAKLRIKNFRSLVDQEINFTPPLANQDGTFTPVTPLTVLVGMNDSGKSNVLKALNLFFNGEIAPGVPMVFERDHSRFAVTPTKKAKEIQITLEVQPPIGFSDRRIITWEKRWRQDSYGHQPCSDKMLFGKDREKKRRSKNIAWLDNLTYKYVPAIRGNDYFSLLLRDLHNVLAATIDRGLKGAANEFINIIREHTQSISQSVSANLKLDSRIRLPEDLSALFEVLDFETNNSVSLNQRGDGIKARHIPIVLRFLAKQQNELKGVLRTDTIWGYEEPENNLEMGKASEQAKEFLDYSEDVQILLTTHSPAFYSLAGKDAGCSAMRVISSNGITSISPIQDIDQVDSDMGILPLITSRYGEIIKEHNAYRNLAKKQGIVNAPTILVEGEFDKIVLQRVFEVLFPQMEINIRGEGGVNDLKNAMIGHVYRGKTEYKIVGIFDGDDAGREAKSCFEKIKEGNNANQKRVKALILSDFKPSHIITIIHAIRSMGTAIPVTMESFFPPAFWDYAENKEWLEKIEKTPRCLRELPFEVSARDHCEQKGLTKEQMRYIRHKVRYEHKKAFAKYAAGQLSTNNIPDGLRRLAEEIKATLDED